MISRPSLVDNLTARQGRAGQGRTKSTAFLTKAGTGQVKSKSKAKRP